MTPTTARRRRLVIVTASLLTLAAAVPGCVAQATEDPDSGQKPATRNQGNASEGASAGAPGNTRGNSPGNTPGNAPGNKGKSDNERPGDGSRTPAPPTSGRPTAPPVSPTPPANVSPDISHESESPGTAVNLTIDDGPDPTWTPKVLDLLQKYQAHATFCMIGPQAKAQPDLVKKVVAAGHRLCDHSVDHNTAMDKRPEDYQRQQILDAQKMIEDAAGGTKVRYYRAPGGAFTPYSRQLAASHGMRPLGWNIDTRDWTRPGADRIIATVKSGLREGPTILFHDGGGDRSQTVAALGELLPWLKQQGYAFSYPKA
ncbi:polysaccharide deacetylase family protein [Streptomyces gamaensis]|uniref:Polysaccharide deacetylase family protein n=1 Tax=Streptomyces gamaensis TaxID=1763542 RepID=A0ABW0YXP0_9ACTN